MLHHLENTLLFLPPGAASPHHAQGRLSVNARLRISPLCLSIRILPAVISRCTFIKAAEG